MNHIFVMSFRQGPSVIDKNRPAELFVSMFHLFEPGIANAISSFKLLEKNYIYLFFYYLINHVN